MVTMATYSHILVHSYTSINAGLLALALATAAPLPAHAQAPASAKPAPPAQAATAPNAAANEELFDAVRAGDVARVTRALDKGADVNAKTRYGSTPLTAAADRENLEVAKLLIDRGADLNVKDTFYGIRPIDMALGKPTNALAILLLERGAKGASDALRTALQSGDQALAKAALASSDLTPANVTSVLAFAKTAPKADAAVKELIAAKAASMPPPSAPAVTVDRKTQESYVGRYRNEGSGFTITVTQESDQLKAALGGPPLTLVPTSQTDFAALEQEGITLAFGGRGGLIEYVNVTRGSNTTTLNRVTDGAVPSNTNAAAGTPAPSGGANTAATETTPTRPVARTAARPWPSFRGDNAAGNGDGQGIVAEWNLEKGQNVRWKTPIPGISNASPIVWGNKVFVVTAISSAGDNSFRTGLYGDVAPVKDLSEHTWKIFCLDRSNGAILWERTAFTGLPKTKRHTKATQANSTPVTDGKHVVAIFGSIGLLMAWDVNGKPLWKTDVGVLNSGWFFDPEYQWGHSSSPIIYKNTVIVQADQQKGSSLAAYDLGSGKQVWRTERDEIPTWGTPTLFRTGTREQLVTNGTKVRGYDPATGKLLWTLGPNSEITVGTPVVGDGLVYVTGGYPPARPIYAIKPTMTGEVTLTKEQATNDHLAWTNDREGTYIPTPIFYDGILYTFGNNGILTAYDGKTGERIYRSRVGGGGSFSSSPIAADGRLYFANEDGDIYVVKAGRTYQELGKNQMKEVIMSTPAIADGLLIVRTLGHVYGIGEKPGASADTRH